MRILRIADVPNDRLGGVSRTMYFSGKALEARGHTVDSVYSDGLRVLGPQRTRRFTVPLVVLSIVRERQRAGRRYDVVEVIEPLGAPLCWTRRRNGDIPPVVAYSYGLEERFRTANLDYRRAKCLPVTLKTRYSPYTVILQSSYAVRHADHVICANPSDVRYLEAAGVPTDRVSFVPTGVEPALIEAGARLGPVERDGVLFYGTWILRKGVLDLVPAMTEVMRRHAGLTFTIAGTRDRPHVARLFPSDVRARINVVPEVRSRAALVDLCRSQAILVLPSFFEGQPLVMAEAAAMGLAIVATDIPGLNDFVVDGRTGALVPVADETALARAVDRLVGDPRLARQLGEAARREAAVYTWERSARRIEECYVAAASGTSSAA